MYGRQFNRGWKHGSPRTRNLTKRSPVAKRAAPPVPALLVKGDKVTMPELRGLARSRREREFVGRTVL